MNLGVFVVDFSSSFWQLYLIVPENVGQQLNPSHEIFTVMGLKLTKLLIYWKPKVGYFLGC